MSWKTTLHKLEQTKKWDCAITLMQQVITEQPDNLDAYLSINYLLMNLLVEEEHPEGFNHQLYEQILKHYFDESYSKFHDNPEYLFYTGITAIMSEWYFDIDINTAEKFLEQALHFEPNNVLYQWGYYSSLEGPQNREKEYCCALKILKNNSFYKNELQLKGSLGKYILVIMNGSNKRIEKELANKKICLDQS